MGESRLKAWVDALRVDWGLDEGGRLLPLGVLSEGKVVGRQWEPVEWQVGRVCGWLFRPACL